MINENVLKGKWKEIKGEMQRAWGSLTDSELDQANGSATSLAGLVQKKFGLAQDDAEKRIGKIIAGFGEAKEDPTSSSREEPRH